MSAGILPHVELATGPDPKGAVIWMHGLGADGWDFVPIVKELPLPGDLALRFIFPHAPQRAVTINNGHRMPAWYDIDAPASSSDGTMDIARNQDEGGIRESQAAIERLLAREQERGMASDRIVLAGFSQGGAIALQTGLRYAQPLAGIIALSTYLTLDESLDREASEANRRTPIFMAHGSQDPIVPPALGEASRAKLEARGYGVEFHAYPMPHAVCGDEVADLGTWLAARFASRILLA